MTNHKGVVNQYLSNIQKSDLRVILYIPLAVSIIFIVVVSIGNFTKVIDFLLTVIPTVSSIILGFLGMLVVATFSKNSIFDRMKEDVIQDRKSNNISMFRLFLNGLFFNMVLEVALLFVSIFIGSINSSFVISNQIFLLESFLLMFLLTSSCLLFLMNMNRIYMITSYLSP